MKVHELAARLISFNTTNPPGNEKAAQLYLKELFTAEGFAVELLAKKEGRPNLITRLKGATEDPPLLFYGHIDVVTTEGQSWTHPPFSAHMSEGFLWGRGALDMKSGLSMMACAIIEAKRRGIVPVRDIIFLSLADEEAGGDFGASFLVDERPDLFEGVKYAIGEFGGFSFHLGSAVLYPIMVAEKEICHVRAVARGQSGHASQPVREGAMFHMARFIQAIEEQPAPKMMLPVVRELLDTISAVLPETNAPLPPIIQPLLRPTVSPTMISGSSALNVIPAEVTADLDCRLLPGQKPDDIILHLKKLAGENVTIELIRHEKSSPEPDMTLFGQLGNILKNLDENAVPCPFVLSGSTDGRHFSRLGIQTYGFTPLKLPPDFDFFHLAHAPDERVPIAALDFGLQALLQLIELPAQEENNQL